MTAGTGRRRQPAARTARDDRDTVHELVERHLGLVRRIARRHAVRDEDVDDLFQEGVVGLLKAIRRFDPDRGVPFAAYASTAVDGEIRHHLRDRSSCLRLPEPLQELRARLRVLAEEARARTGTEPELTALAADAGVDHDAAVEAATAGVVPLDSDVPAPESELRRTEARADVEVRLASLDRRAREVVYLRFFADLTQAEIAARLGVSQMHVSRILRTALEAMRGGHDG
jgi:RNA polymerase sigma-B factor